MFVGHLAVALAAKRAAPDANLGWLVAGVTALDLVWPILLLAGIERVTVAPGATAFTPLIFDSYPWSHSLLMSFVWGLVLVGIARAARVQASPALLVALVVSHWVLDFVTHAPDMPLWPGNSPRFGLTLWNSIPATLIIEGAMWIAGIMMYKGVLARTGQRPGWPFWAFVVVCTLMWASGPWSPPPSVETIGYFALIGWIVIPWSAWADRARRPTSSR